MRTEADRDGDYYGGMVSECMNGSRLASEVDKTGRKMKAELNSKGETREQGLESKDWRE